MFQFDTTYLTQMKREPGYKWWKPIVAVILFMIFNLLFSLPILLVQDTYNLVKEYNAGGLAQKAVDSGNYLNIDFADPLSLFWEFVPMALIILEIALAMKLSKLGGLKTLHSTEYKIRWKRLFDFMPLLIVLYIVVEVVDQLIKTATGTPFGGFRFPIASLILILIFVPLQASAEEYMFRGFLTQAIGSWVPVAAIAWVLQAVCFMVMHGYNLLGNLGILITGLCMGYVVLKTGGLEASMAMHIINNLAAGFTTALIIGNDVKKDTDVPTFLIDVILTVGSCILVMYVAKKKGYIATPQAVAASADTESASEATSKEA